MTIRQGSVSSFGSDDKTFIIDETEIPRDMDDYTVEDYERMMKQREPLDNRELKAIIDKKRKPEKPRPLV